MSEQPLSTVLHVDDNEANRYIVTRMLRNAGFNVIEAATGKAGLHLLSEQRPDMIILDVKLPDITGFELCQQIKGNAATASVPVLMMSANFLEIKDKAQGLESGADAYLTQPVESLDLIATVRALLRMYRAEAAAMGLAQEWQNTFDAMNDGVCLLNPEGRVLRCNRAMTEILSKPFSEIRGCLYQELVPPPIGTKEAFSLTRIRESRRQSLELPLGERWFSLTIDSIVDEHESFTGVVCILTDITERRRTEVLLRSSEERFRLLLENVKDYGILFIAPDTKIISCSAGAEQILGYQEAEILGQSISCIFTPEDLQQGVDRQELERAVAEGRAEDERWHLRKDGSRFWASGIVTPLWDENGQLHGFAKILRDFTERKRAEEQITRLNTDLERQVQERTAQLQKALEFEAMLKRITDKVRDSLDESQILQTAVQELTLVLDLSGCNAAWYNLVDCTSTICYEYVTKIPASQSRAAQMANFPEIYRQLLSGQYFQFCSIVPNPVRGRVAMLACPIVSDEGVLGDLWLINQQDHAFNELEIRLVQQVANQCAIAVRQARLYQAATAQVAELENLNRLKDDFLSTVSHELRTPISNMKMAIRMLQIADEAVARERYFKILQAECDREVELINDLLDLQRLEEASYDLSPEAVNLQDWLPGIIEPFRSRTTSRQQTLQVNFSPDLPPLLSNRASLERILAELLNNACKYTPPGGEIVLSIRHNSTPAPCSPYEAEATIFTISNSVEIPQTQLPRIFDKFYRIPKADPWKQSGTGLGLALVQKLVEQLQGTIQVESGSEWTTFTLVLQKLARV